jgi:hypothetical protein
MMCIEDGNDPPVVVGSTYVESGTGNAFVYAPCRRIGLYPSGNRVPFPYPVHVPTTYPVPSTESTRVPCNSTHREERDVDRRPESVGIRPSSRGGRRSGLGCTDGRGSVGSGLVSGAWWVVGGGCLAERGRGRR